MRSPLQLGSATRVEFADRVSSLLAVVMHLHLADEVVVKITRVLNRVAYLTPGYSASLPGEASRRRLGGRSPGAKRLAGRPRAGAQKT